MAFELLLWHIFGWIHSATIEGFTFARGYCHRNPALHKEDIPPQYFFEDIPLYRISGKTPSQVSLKLFPHSEIPPGITSHSISVGVFPHNISQNILPRTVSLWKYSLTVSLKVILFYFEVSLLKVYFTSHYLSGSIPSQYISQSI